MLSSSSTLADQLKGRVIDPGDPDYDEARTVFYGDVDRRPSAIVTVANADDVARVIAHAREDGLELAVRSGGHSVAGHSTTEGGIVIDLSDMKELEIDPEGRTAWAETGLTAGEYTSAAARHGLATGLRRHRVGRHRRDHAGRRGRLPGAQARAHDRRPAGRRGRDRGRRAPARGRRHAPGPVLGDPRRRRQLRRRHALPVPAARLESVRRRHAVPAGHAGRDRRLRGRGGGGARGAVDDRQRHDRRRRCRSCRRRCTASCS